MKSDEPSLNDLLRQAGFRHRPAPGGTGYRREIVDTEGRVVFVGHAHEVSAWLREKGLAPT